MLVMIMVYYQISSYPYHLSACFFTVLFLSLTPKIQIEIILKTPKTIKKIPNHIDKLLLSILLAKKELATELTTPVIAIGIENLYLTNLFLKCIINANMLIGKNASKFIACAFCCVRLSPKVSKGINKVPPPMPMPPKTPPIIPKIINKNIYIKHPFYKIYK